MAEAHLSLLNGLPFAGLLLCIATGPVLFPHAWERHHGKIAAFWSTCVLGPALLRLGPGEVAHGLLHLALLDYIPFLILVGSLYVAAGGIVVDGRLAGTPARTTALLGAGAFLASLLGTTGASMVLVRPLLKGIASRRRKAHSVVFFIFLVSNVGGCLTPIGDPPLFLGFLHGVPFLWTLHSLGPMLFLTASLLTIHFFLDLKAWDDETDRTHHFVEDKAIGFGIRGKRNILLLVLMVLTVLASGMVGDALGSVTVLGNEMDWSGIARDLLLLALAGLSLKHTPARLHKANSFSWSPIREVAALFAGIFVCLLPLMSILREGSQGALGWLVAGVRTPLQYFWATGILSSFLDNAPTYLLFLNVAGGDAALPRMIAERTTLLAISCGAVFMGANSYIGNAPNFLVRNLAEDHGVRMPSFGGYLLWSGCILVPLLALTGWIFF